MGMIHWKQQTEIPGSYRQYGYNDTIDFTVPFTLDIADKRKDSTKLRADITCAIYNRRTGGRYGTSYSVKGIDLDKGIITVQASTYIGD